MIKVENFLSRNKCLDRLLSNMHKNKPSFAEKSRQQKTTNTNTQESRTDAGQSQECADSDEPPPDSLSRLIFEEGFQIDDSKKKSSIKEFEFTDELLEWYEAVNFYGLMTRTYYEPYYEQDITQTSTEEYRILFDNNQYAKKKLKMTDVLGLVWVVSDIPFANRLVDGSDTLDYYCSLSKELLMPEVDWCF